MYDQLVDTLRSALITGHLATLEDVLADDVRWYGNFPGGSCHTRDDVLALLRAQLDEGARPRLTSNRAVGDRLLASIEISTPNGDATVWLVLTLDAGRIVELQDYSTEAAAEHDLALRAADPPQPA